MAKAVNTQVVAEFLVSRYGMHTGTWDLGFS